MVSRTNSTYGISRVDNHVSRTHGWLVTIQRRGVIYRKHFSDGTYGGKQKSYVAAKAYRDEVIEKHPPFTMKEYSNIVKKSNRSGVVGVCRYCASETRGLPEEQQRWFWVASWPLPSGQRKRVKFAVNKYGEEGAFKMALKARRDAMRQLEGAFDPGAVRRRRRSPSAQVADDKAKPKSKSKANGATKASASAKRSGELKPQSATRVKLSTASSGRPLSVRARVAVPVSVRRPRAVSAV